MRITNSMMVSQFLSDANASLNRVCKYQNQVDSTKKNSSISDDPQATVTTLRARNRLSELELYQRNITTANSYLSEAESSADELNDILQSVYENLISARDGAYSDKEIADIADEIGSLMDEVVSIGNTSIGTSYIFSGYNYTGSGGGSGMTAPFSVNKATGDLLYNGINLSQVAWAEDFDTEISGMSDSASGILDLASRLTSSLSDQFALDISSEALGNAGKLISRCAAALDAAKEYGIDSETEAYQALSDFQSAFASLYDELENECSKGVAGDYILTSDPSIRLTDEGKIDYDYYKANGVAVMTDDEYGNCFSNSKCQTILADMAALIDEQDDGSGGTVPSVMDQAADGLASVVVVSPDAQAALDAEGGDRTKLQVGTDKAVEITFSGLDLMGRGSDNIYHILEKCTSILHGDIDSGALGGMITKVQDAQSSVLNFETRIGASENRLSLISSRYDSSELNYTEMKSEAEDADLAEAITNYTTAQTVYSAALAAGAEIIQTSLIDFLR